MLNNAVSTGNMMVGRLISGFLAMSLDHPVLLCLIVSAMAGSACAVLLDAVGAWPSKAPAMDVRPIRLRRS